MPPVIRAACARIAAAGGAGLLAACTQADPPADPCAGAATCVRLDIDSGVIRTIDQLELDMVIAGQHAAGSPVTTGTVGTTVDLPFSLPVTLDLPAPPVIQVDFTVAGKLGGSVLGAAWVSTMVQQGQHASGLVLLESMDPCVEGALYCGGTGVGVLADGSTLYRCTGGVPIYDAACSAGCFPHYQPDGVCFGDGTCRDGGTYCGGHLVDGDPSTLYVCRLFAGTQPMPCPAGCDIRGDGNDACK
ncbi:MAG TPA: hypothetical protein VHT91_01415 [Kofleriaceae bacterium]|jgi:hypothetical protein|nr:hypothetical protein [Kofleriaceae bacterium]